ncbi:hypothetical protein HNP97_001078 [Methanococcus maripaludis]|uniref:Uncharacterized protein n=1 Tax=Methanococcus maripaludis TaxID=39152 RepID=A0A7J9S210_METMI|nr:hypothetical protein [Methanococcus maripaludis]
MIRICPKCLKAVVHYDKVPIDIKHKASERTGSFEKET